MDNNTHKTYVLYSHTNQGIGLCALLFVVFLVLKLTGYIAWSWLWVTCPLWAGLGIVVVVLLLMLLFLGLLYMLQWTKRLVRWVFGLGEYK